MHAAHVAFMHWATAYAAYEEGSEDMRSRQRHETWLAALPCPCFRFEGPFVVEEQITRLEKPLPGVRLGALHCSNREHR
jgi:hypothetical protein